MMHKIHKFLQLAVLCLALTVLALSSVSMQAQSSYGQITGSVTDASGGSAPGATIKVINVGTQTARTVLSDDGGYFILTNLPIGEYTVEISKEGFRGEKRSGVAISADAHLTADFALAVGATSESVTVSAVAGEALNTTSGEVARVIDSKQVENLALNGRNYTQLLTLVPGAVVTNPDVFSVTTSLASNNQTINGNRSDSGNLTVDGAYNQVAGSNGSLMNNVGPDFIQEVKINTSNASAEFGRTSGPSFNIVTKSGTNAFHGGAFEFLRNNYLDATNYIAKQKTQLVYNDFGFFIGGPIIKDKLFFFVGEEWKRLRTQAIATTFTVPTTAMTNGDFAAVCTNAVDANKNPGVFVGGVCTATAGQLYRPGTSTPILNNNISSLITPDGRALANVYKTITATGLSFRDGGLPSNNLTLAPTNPLNFHQDLIRFDWSINQKHSLYGRWIHDQNQLTDPYGTFSNTGILPTTPTIRNRPGQSYLLAYTWFIRPNLINQAQVNTSWAAQRIPPAGDLWKRETYGFQYNKLYANAGPYPNGIPQVNITGYAPMQGPNFALQSPSTDIQIADSVTWLKGNHNLKAGVVVIRDRVDQNGRSNYTGTANFVTSASTCKSVTANSTCYALADALLGNFNNYSEASSDPVGHFRFTQPEAFVQDSWKATRKLSLEFGVRWQGIAPWYTQGNNISNFDPNLYNPAQAVKILSNGRIDPNGGGNPYNGLVRAGDGVPADQTKRVTNVNTALFPFIPSGAPRGFYNMHGAFGPRVGFAYSIDDKTVLRGGGGLFFYRAQGNLIFSQLNVAPFLSNTNLDFGNLATLNGGSAAATTQGAISGIDPTTRNPYTYQYSLGVQRQVSRTVLVEANYVGSVSHRQASQPNINFPSLSSVVSNTGFSTNFSNPYKGFTAINENRFVSNYNYNSLQLFASKRAGVITTTLAYTFSKALGDSNGNNQTLENWSNPQYNYGYLSNDRRHAFVASFVIQAPELRGHNFVVRETLGGWQISGVARLQSGGYNNVQAASSLGVGSVRPDIIPGSQIYGNGHAGTAGYLNSAVSTYNGVVSRGAFAPTNSTTTRFGSAPYGAVRMPGLAQTDATLSKFFPITERVRVKFQADAFNVLNRTNFSGVNLTVTNANFGTVSGAYPPRQLQLGAKVNF
ncbi:MAG: Cna domain protein [Acidobacteriaceae bacterium]|nr:Cna domain protein [Acidobacteriaceae bacterium]